MQRGEEFVSVEGIFSRQFSDKRPTPKRDGGRQRVWIEERR